MSQLRCWAVIALLSMIAGCGARYAIFPETEEYLVAKGDTLYSIAWAQELDPEDLARWNRLKAPYRLYPGQPLVLHPTGDETPPTKKERETKPAAPPTTPAIPAKKPTPDIASKPVVPPPTAKPTGPAPVAPKPDVAAIPGSTWRWPADGAAQRADATGGTGRNGLQIAGKLGQPIRAARDGRVVYAGSGLKGYGLLIIVKHDETYLSAYGHNDRLLVKEGDAVAAGQTLAEMGEGPMQQPLVYFEVRKNGRPVDPFTVLPKR